jgi:serine-type D-Ala-D-Ala carboxypeptidase (penicillin-binding protein 5/6)
VSGAAARQPQATAFHHVLVAAARRLLGAAVVCAVALVLTPSAGASAAPPPPALSVRAAILIEQSTGHELYAVDANRELPIASTTKLMTALVTLEHVHHLGTVFTNPEYRAAAVDSQIGLAPGERMSVHDLLLALMLPSADDAAEDLAYNVGHGSVARFIAMMNAQARTLGLARTHYSTPIGLDTPGNYSTAADLVKLASYDLEHSRYFARIVALPHAVLHSGDYPRYVVNRNDLVAEYPWINGVKTGHTADAGYVLVASGHRDGMTLISAVLGTSSEPSRDANTLALLDYGFANFRLAHLVKPGQTLAAPSVHDQPGKHAALVAASGFTDVVARSARIRIRVEAPRQLSGPMPQGARLGSATVLVDGRQLATVPLVLAQAVPAVSSLTLAGRFITKPLMLVLIVGLGFAAALAFAVRRRRRVRASKGGLETA